MILVAPEQTCLQNSDQARWMLLQGTSQTQTDPAQARRSAETSMGVFIMHRAMVSIWTLNAPPVMFHHLCNRAPWVLPVPALAQSRCALDAAL